MLLKNIAIYVIIHMILILNVKHAAEKNYNIYDKYHLLARINQLKMKLKYLNYLYLLMITILK